MKLRVSEIPEGNCFTQGRSTKKKTYDGKVITVKASGKVSTRKIKGDPEVEMTSCPLSLLGVGMRRHPETIVQIGDGNPLRKK